MVSLMELLPLMVDTYGKPAGWRPFQNSETLTLTPGKTKHIGPVDYPGWLRFLILETNNRYTSLQHTIWEKAMVYSPYQLFLNGNIAPGPAGVPWVQTYIVADEKYKLVWEPIPPQEFLAKTDIWVTAPSTNPVTGAVITTDTVITLTWHIILIFDRSRFLASMKEVLTRETATEIAAAIKAYLKTERRL